MNERAKYIKQLEEFNVLLNEWENGNGDSEVRTEINKRAHAVRNIVLHTGTLQLYHIGPPPALGGMIVKNVDPFSCIFDPPYGQSMNDVLIDNIERAIGVIESSPNFTLKETKTKSKKADSPQKKSKRIFVVHGHDNEIKETTARFLEKLDLKPIILHEQINKGKTIIEKFEEYSDVSFAVILMTPDDVGKANNEDSELSTRARQNVIFELGYFLGKLGRKNVAALVKGNIEIPSDYSGILFTGIDPHGQWKMRLATEIKASGIEVDLNKII